MEYVKVEVKGMRRGLRFFPYPVGEKQDSWQAWQGRTGQDRIHAMYDHELAQDCKHKEIIKGANEEGNKERQLWKINQ